MNTVVSNGMLLVLGLKVRCDAIKQKCVAGGLVSGFWVSLSTFIDFYLHCILLQYSK